MPARSIYFNSHATLRTVICFPLAVDNTLIIILAALLAIILAAVFLVKNKFKEKDGNTT